MKILHTSDWHLGQSLHGFNREEEFRDFFVQLRAIIAAEKPDAMLVTGDIFDVPTPSNAVVTMYNKELLRIQLENEGLQTIVVAGNHDSPSRLASAGVLWKEFNVTVVGAPMRKEGEIDLASMVVPICSKGRRLGWVLAVPYMHGSTYPTVENDSYSERVRSFYQRLADKACELRSADEPIVAMGHLTLTQCDLTGHDAAIGNMDSVPVDIWDDRISYVALGHIHRPQQIGHAPVYYSGSILPMSFNEWYGHSVNVVEWEGCKLSAVRQIPIKPLFDIRTVPDKAVPFEEVKEALRGIPNDRKVYIRANILVEGVIPVDMFGEAAACVEGKDNVRFCTLQQVKKEQRQTAEDDFGIHSLEQLRQMSPLEVARKSYRARQQQEMPDALVTCMNEAIGAIYNEGEE